MSAFFNFESLLLTILLLICTCTFIGSKNLERLGKTGFIGIFWKFSRIGERESPYVFGFCVIMAGYVLFFQ